EARSGGVALASMRRQAAATSATWRAWGAVSVRLRGAADVAGDEAGRGKGMSMEVTSCRTAGPCFRASGGCGRRGGRCSPAQGELRPDSCGRGRAAATRRPPAVTRPSRKPLQVRGRCRRVDMIAARYGAPEPSGTPHNFQRERLHMVSAKAAAVALLVLGVVPAGVSAAEGGQWHVGVSGGTLGISPEVGYRFGGHGGLRLNGGFYDYDRSEEIDD